MTSPRLEPGAYALASPPGADAPSCGSMFNLTIAFGNECKKAGIDLHVGVTHDSARVAELTLLRPAETDRLADVMRRVGESQRVDLFMSKGRPDTVKHVNGHAAVEIRRKALLAATRPSST